MWTLNVIQSADAVDAESAVDAMLMVYYNVVFECKGSGG